MRPVSGSLKRKRDGPLPLAKRKRSLSLIRDWVDRLPVGFPDKWTAHLRYTKVTRIDIGLGGQAEVVFAANGCYDPEVALGGRQPYGFDQWMTFYDHYTVTKCRCTVVAQHLGSGGGGIPSVWGLALSDSATAVASKGTLEELLESRIQGPGTNFRLAGGNTDGQIGLNKIVRQVDIGKFANKKDIIGSADFRGTSSSNPSELVYFTAWLRAPNGVDDPWAVDLFITLDFLVHFGEPKPIASS